MKSVFTTAIRPAFLLLSACLLWASVALATDDKNVISENIVQLQEDGRSFVQHRTIRSDWGSYEFHVDKDVSLDQFYYIYPKDSEWDDKSSADTNILKFQQGSFVVMYPGIFKTEVTQAEDGVYTFQSWDGVKATEENFGFWNTPGNFDNFVYAWMFPAKFEVLSYESNQKGDWVARNNTIAFYAQDVNNITFTIKYKEKELPAPEPIPVPVPAPLPDTDADGVLDIVDQCPETPAGMGVTLLGCEKDVDNDGVFDSQDKCPESPGCVVVNAEGCELDADKDGVVNSQDKCPESPADAKVNETGCELDSDKDGVSDAADLCPDTVKGVVVDMTGCNEAAPIALKGVNFKTGSADLTDDSLVILDKVVVSLKGLSGVKL